MPDIQGSLGLAVDYSRHEGLLDRTLLANTHIACIGVGGASGLVQSLTRCGIHHWTLIDFDRVSASNPATQSYELFDYGNAKCEALAQRLLHIEPHVRVMPITKPYEHLDVAEHMTLWDADVVLAMTDDFKTQARINADAIAHGVDAIFAICYVGCEAVEVTASFTDTIAADGGCHRCHTKARYDAYADGFENPVEIASYALAADYLNALLGNIVLGRLHAAAGSNLPIAELGRDFAAKPCLFSRITPGFGARDGEAFARSARLPFTTTLWPLDTPEGFRCPDCGTRGSVAVHRPLAIPGPGPTEERRA